MRKIKITYFEYGLIKAKIIYISSWWNIVNDISNQQIQLDNIIKIEVLMEADENNTIDLTKNE